jgi:hypothetical protein
MPVYRLYWVGTDDHFNLGVSFECASDKEALEAAQEMIGEFAAEFAAVEVWVTGRFVGRVGSHRHLRRPSPFSARQTPRPPRSGFRLAASAEVCGGPTSSCE